MMKINLLPQTRKTYFYYLSIPSFLIGAMLILLLWHMYLQQKINITTKHNNYMERELGILKTQMQNYSVPTKQQMEQKLKNHITTLEQKRIIFAQIFETLNQGVVGNLYLTQLLIKNSEIKIVGQTKSILDLVKLLKKLTTIKYSKNTLSIQKLIKQEDSYSFLLLLLRR